MLRFYSVRRRTRRVKLRLRGYTASLKMTRKIRGITIFGRGRRLDDPFDEISQSILVRRFFFANATLGGSCAIQDKQTPTLAAAPAMTRCTKTPSVVPSADEVALYPRPLPGGGCRTCVRLGEHACTKGYAFVVGYGWNN